MVQHHLGARQEMPGQSKRSLVNPPQFLLWESVASHHDGSVRWRPLYDENEYWILDYGMARTVE